ncbi:MAG: lamin tail domain-containing protein, partial [Planctomycetes bacterium]|nr:lamin tail domain-containing protein [Planctomycetota bacterium]
WSALQEAVFQPLQAAPLAITEINYNPPSLATDGGWNNDDFEFVELYNNGTETINLAGYAFVDGIEFDFAASPVTTLDPGGYVLIVSNPAAFASRYDTTDLVIAGQYTGSLSNGGERITLNAGGRLYCSFAYDDSAAWPGRADGKGATLEAIPGGDVEDDDAWRSSGEFLGTPGAAGAGPLGDVVVSEVLSRTTSPKIDRIELHNTTDDDIDISGWFLSDTWTHYRKFRIPNGTVIRAGDYVSFDERDFNPRGLTPDPADDTPEDFQLDGTTGDDVWVMAADPLTGQLLRFVDHVEFGAGLDQLPLGRWPDADGRLVPMTEATFDGANSGPLVGPVVVSEVMYHAENTDLEFIELHNAGTDEADISGWRLNGAVDFTFDAGTVLDAGECLVVLPFDPTAPANAARLAAFQTEYGLTDPIAMVGGWTGHLDNSGERIELLYRRPGGPEHVWAFVLAEEATFDDGPDWPAEAAGEGSSLVRIDEEVWGSYPTNWEALEPSPGVGREAGPLPGDADLDGDVDLDDFVILKQNFGTLAGATWEMADFTGEGAVDLDDFVILKQNFGTVATAVSAVDVLAELRVADAGEPASVPPARPVERAAVRRLRRRAPGRGAPQPPATMNVLDLMRLGRPLG